MCRTNCLLRRCGDNITDDRYSEDCDDGNLLEGDGCSPECKGSASAAVQGKFGMSVLFPSRYGMMSRFPTGATLRGMQYNVPLASVQSLYNIPAMKEFASRPVTGDTGPGAIAVIAVGSAIGWAVSRRRRKR